MHHGKDFHRVSVHCATKNLPVVVFNLVTTGSRHNQAKKRMLQTWDSEATLLLSLLYDSYHSMDREFLTAVHHQHVFQTFLKVKSQKYERGISIQFRLADTISLSASAMELQRLRMMQNLVAWWLCSLSIKLSPWYCLKKDIKWSFIRH